MRIEFVVLPASCQGHSLDPCRTLLTKGGSGMRRGACASAFGCARDQIW